MQHLSQLAVLGQVQIRIKGEDFSRRAAGVLKDIRVVEDISYAEFHDPALADPEEIPGAPELQVLSRDIKTVVGFIEDFQPFDVVSSLFPWIKIQ